MIPQQARAVGGLEGTQGCVALPWQDLRKNVMFQKQQKLSNKEEHRDGHEYSNRAVALMDERLSGARQTRTREETWWTRSPSWCLEGGKARGAYEHHAGRRITPRRLSYLYKHATKIVGSSRIRAGRGDGGIVMMLLTTCRDNNTAANKPGISREYGCYI